MQAVFGEHKSTKLFHELFARIGDVRAEIAWRYRGNYYFKKAKHVHHERPSNTGSFLLALGYLIFSTTHSRFSVVLYKNLRAAT